MGLMTFQKQRRDKAKKLAESQKKTKPASKKKATK